jgi:hypothetical protein
MIFQERFPAEILRARNFNFNSHMLLMLHDNQVLRNVRRTCLILKNLLSRLRFHRLVVFDNIEGQVSDFGVKSSTPDMVAFRLALQRFLLFALADNPSDHGLYFLPSRHQW